MIGPLALPSEAGGNGRGTTETPSSAASHVRGRRLRGRGLWGPAAVLVVALLWVAPLTGCGGADHGRPIRKARGAVVATVNGQPIDHPSVERMSRLVAQKLRSGQESGGAGMDSALATSDPLEKLIDRELALQDAYRRGISADTARVNDAVRQIRNNRGMDTLLITGMSDAEIGEYLSDDIVFNTYLQRTVIDSIEVTDGEMTAYMEAHPELFLTPETIHASQILIALDTVNATPEARSAARKQAEALLREVRTPGADFAAIARAKSKDTNSAPRGGDLGMLAKGQTVPSFDEAAFALAPGEISDVVETPYGYHIIKVDSKSGASPRSLDSARTQLSAFLRQEKAHDAIRARLEGLRRTARISYRKSA